MSGPERRAAVELVAAELGMSAAGVEALVSLIGSPLRESPPELIDAAEVARRFGKSRDWVYDNAGTLGAVRLGDGPRPRLAFDPQRVREYLESQKRQNAQESPRPISARRRRTASVPLLPVGRK